MPVFFTTHIGGGGAVTQPSLRFFFFKPADASTPLESRRGRTLVLAHQMDTSWNLPLRRVPVRANKDASVVWNTVHLCYEQKLFGQVTSMCYNTAGTILGATSSNQLSLLRVPQTEGVVVNEQTEKKNYSIRFREDDKLFVQAVEQRVIVKSTETAFERQFLGHTRDVRCALFLGKHNFVSGSDDTTIRLWDLLSENELGIGRVHTDYVRSLEPYTSGAFFSGSYDHVVNLWDPRAGLTAPLQTTGSALENAVEALCYLREEELLACGCGDQTVLFDLRKGLTAPLFCSSFHTKAVVSIAFSAYHKTLVTSSLDGRVKMLAVDGGELRSLATKKFDGPVSAVAVHPSSKEYAVGMTSGDVKVFRFPEVVSEEGGDDLTKRKLSESEVLQQKMHSVEHQLSSFQYGKALKTALYSRHPDVLVSALEELIRRGALHVALSNQNDRTVVRVLRFAAEYVDKPQFTDTMIAVFNDLFDIYGTSVGKSEFLHREMMMAQKKVGAALAVLKRMEKSASVMEVIVSVE